MSQPRWRQSCSEHINLINHGDNIKKVVTLGLCGTTAPSGPGPPDLEVSQSPSDTPLSVGCLWMSDQFVAETSTCKNIHHSQQTNIHALGDIRTRNRSKRAAADPRQRPRGNPCRKAECSVVLVNNMKSLNRTCNVAWLITSAVDRSVAQCSRHLPLFLFIYKGNVSKYLSFRLQNCVQNVGVYFEI